MSSKSYTPFPSCSHQKRAAATRACCSSSSTRRRPSPIAILSAAIITTLFSCPATPTAGSRSLASMIDYTLYRTQLPHPVTLAGLVLLRRLKQKHPSARGSCGYRLFIAAVMLSSKYHCDENFSSASWSVATRSTLTIKDVNQMERELFAHLDMHIDVQQSEIDGLLRALSTSSSTLVPPHVLPPPTNCLPPTPHLTPSTSATASDDHTPDSSPDVSPRTPASVHLPHPPPLHKGVRHHAGDVHAMLIGRVV